MKPTIRSLTPNDFNEILSINNANVPALSGLDLERLQHLVAHSLHALVVEQTSIVGFCLTFSNNAPYDSRNYQWFRNRYEHFVYLDRVAFIPEAQGIGLGKLLYNHLEALMREYSPNQPLCCEVNLEPPNLQSLRFHERLGFIRVANIDHGNDYKVVMLEKKLPTKSL